MIHAGYYVDSTGQTTQTACAAGTYQANTGQSSCNNADAGYYVDSTVNLVKQHVQEHIKQILANHLVIMQMQDIMLILQVNLVKQHVD